MSGGHAPVAGSTPASAAVEVINVELVVLAETIIEACGISIELGDRYFHNRGAVYEILSRHFKEVNANDQTRDGGTRSKDDAENSESKSRKFDPAAGVPTKALPLSNEPLQRYVDLAREGRKETEARRAAGVCPNPDCKNGRIKFYLGGSDFTDNECPTCKGTGKV